MVVCQTNRDTDCEQQCHVVDKCAAGFYKEEADKIKATLEEAGAKVEVK